MPIEVICPSGHLLEIPDRLLGKTVRCPHCDQPVLVEPPIDLSAIEEEVVEPLYDPLAQPSADPLATYASPQASAPVASAWTPTKAPEPPPPHFLTTTLGKIILTFSGSCTGLLLGMLVLWMAGAFSSPAGTRAEVNQANSGPDDPPITNVGPPQLAVPEVSEAIVKLRDIMLATANYYDMFKSFPPNGRNPKGGLSWRVHLLPFLGYRGLYEKFKLDEVWDSPANKALLDQMPDIYRLGSEKRSNTRFQIPQGDKLLYSLSRQTYSEIGDGIQRTLVQLVVGPEKAVPWTCPDDFNFDTQKPHESIGKVDGNTLVACSAVEMFALDMQMKPDELVGLITPNGGEVIDPKVIMQKFLDIGESRQLTKYAGSNFAQQWKPPPQDQARQLVSLTNALQNHNEVYRAMAPIVGQRKPDQRDSELKKAPSLLSWRVHILPFIGHQQLYSKFKLDEPWDSPANKPLLDEMPADYRIDNQPGSTTRFQVIQGEEMFFGSSKPADNRSVSDGQGNTLAIVIVGADKAVPWTQPYDIKADESSLLAKLGKLDQELLYCSTLDGRLWVLPPTLKETQLKALATPRGNEFMDIASLALRRKTPTRLPANKATTSPQAAAVSGRSGASGQGPLAAKSYKLPQQLRMCAMGMHTHAQDFKQLCPPPSDRPGGGLSWRVHILPYLGQYELYAKFNFNEPWDSPSNRKLVNSIPPCFDTGDGGKTRLRAFDSLVGGKYRGPFSQPDDPRNTIMVMVVGKSLATEWTRPEEMPATDEMANQIIASLGSQPVQCIMLDTMVAVIDTKIAKENLKAMATLESSDQVSIDSKREAPTPEDAAILQAMGKIQEQARARADRMKSIILALQNYQSIYKIYPPAKTHLTRDGDENLSWRVHILPMLGHETLYQKFNQQEPWNSATNQALLASMPSEFMDPAGPTDATTTTILMLRGQGTLRDNLLGANPRQIENHQAIMLVNADASQAVPWTKPADLEFDPQQPWSRFGSINKHRIQVACEDGRVVSLKTMMPPELWKALVSPKLGEPAPIWKIEYGVNF